MMVLVPIIKHAKWCQDALATLFSSFSNSWRELVAAASRE
jgi:hypothetical protein